jgi:hypothetical protein
MAGSFKVLLGLSKRLMTFQTALDQNKSRSRTAGRLLKSRQRD